MTREQAKNEIRQRVRCEAFLQKSKSGLYVCPYCGSGDGPHKTGALKIYPENTFTCHACNKSGDVIDLYQQKTGADFNTALTLLAQELGIEIDGRRAGSGPERDPARKTEESPTEGSRTAQRPYNKATEANYTEYYRECFDRLNDPRAQAYLKKRGISQATAEAFVLGFDPEADPAAAPGARSGDPVEKKHPCPRLILPCSASHYVGRRIENQGDGFDKMNPAGSTPGIFGKSCLYTQEAQEIFITEGVFDALSIIEAGETAIATNSAANVDLLLSDLKDRPTKATLILCLDNDDRGQKGRQKLEEGLQDLGVDYIVADVCGGYKDPNDALTGNREQFTERVKEAVTEARAHRTQKAAEEQEAQEAKLKKYLENSAAAYLPTFETEIRGRANVPAISTGFYSLDQILDGGLYEGLYIMGAISSLGKTTFALQLMDNIAKAGKDVLIFSLEMARSELMAKSISRQTFLLSEGRTKDAKTTRGILAGSRYGNYSQNERDLIRKAKDAYREYAGRIFIVEGVGNVGTDQIKEFVKRHREITGQAPVVLIDYLQLLAPTDPRYSDKQNTDRAVLELKRMSRDYKIPVVAVSSFNRDNYTAPVNLASFKESGAIEYSSDVLLGLQYEGMDYQEGEAEKARDKRIRELLKGMEEAAREGGTQQIQVKILKNRNGNRGSVAFTYRPIFNYFTDGKDPNGFEVVDEAEQLPFNWDDTQIN